MKSIFLSLLIMVCQMTTQTHAQTPEKTEQAVFAMGCFWCGAAAFSYHKDEMKYPGVTSVRAGYGGGTMPNPTYENHTGYKEVVRLTYDPTKANYEQLLDVFWKNVDPFDAKGQFCDKGFAYTSAIYYANDTQKALAEKTKAAVEKQLGQKVETEILPLTTFVEAEEYHQDYKAKNPVRYQYYSWSCGRAKRLAEIWGKQPKYHRPGAEKPGP